MVSSRRKLCDRGFWFSFFPHALVLKSFSSYSEPQIQVIYFSSAVLFPLIASVFFVFWHCYDLFVIILLFFFLSLIRCLCTWHYLFRVRVCVKDLDMQRSSDPLFIAILPGAIYVITLALYFPCLRSFILSYMPTAPTCQEYLWSNPS